MKKILFISIMAAFLAGCATGYHSAGMIGGGYKEKSLGPNRMQVSFVGSAVTSQAQVYRFTMKRAAELTMNRGYRYFEVLSKHNYLKHQHDELASGTFDNDFPHSVLKIKFVRNKTARAYDAQKVFTSVAE